MNRSARSRRAAVSVTASRPVQSRSRRVRAERRGRPRRPPGPPTSDHPPAVVEEPADQGPPVPGRPALGRGPGAEVDRQQRGRRRRTGRRGAQSGSSQASGSSRPERRRGRGRAPIGPTAEPTSGRARPDRPGQASRSAWATRTRSRSVAWTRTRAGPSSGRPRRSSRASRDATSCRPGTQSGHVGQEEPAAAHRPAEPPGDARPGPGRGRSGCRPGRRSPGRIRATRSERPSVQTAEPERPTPRPTLEPVPVGQVDAVDLGVGLEDLAVARRGEDLDRRPGIGRAEPGEDRAGQDRVAHVVELDDQDLAGAIDRARPGGTAARARIRIDPTASRTRTEIRHRHLV